MWPTPKSSEPGMSAKTSGRNVSNSTHLTTQVAISEGMVDMQTGRLKYPTPRSRDYKDGMSVPPSRSEEPGKDTLGQFVARSFPTPGTTGLSNGSGNCEKVNRLYDDGLISDEERRSFRAGNGGNLNPDWTEWLMGWPIGWTSLEPMIADMYWMWKGNINGWWKGDPADYAWLPQGIVPRVTIVKTNRVSRIKAIGNGQVPQALVLAWEILSSEVRR